MEYIPCNKTSSFKKTWKIGVDIETILLKIDINFLYIFLYPLTNKSVNTSIAVFILCVMSTV